MLNEKKNKGITLIALVVSIIVLLILAGVSISAITGNESAMEKAKEARTANEQGAELEQIKLAVVSAMSQGLDVKVSAANLRTSLNGIVTQTEIDKVTENGPWIIQGNSGREYKITNNGLVNALETMDKAIINPISVEEGSTVEIVISNGDNIEEIKTCTIANTSIATVEKYTDNVWKITGGTLTGDDSEVNTTLTIEGKSGKKIEGINLIVTKTIIPAIGDFVNYNAGEWTTDEIATLGNLYSGENKPTTGYTFGGFTVGASRNDDHIGSGKSGWKILELNNDGTIKKIIHCGCPEYYCHPNENNSGYKSQYILSGTINPSGNSSWEYNNIQRRNWDMYKDSIFADQNSEITVVNYEDTNDLSNKGLLNINFLYWLSNAVHNNDLNYVKSTGQIGNSYSDKPTLSCGIRLIITLKSGITVTGSTSIVHNSSSTAWTLKQK